LEALFGKPLRKVFGDRFPAASHHPAALLQEHRTLTWFLQRIFDFFGTLPSFAADVKSKFQDNI